MCVLDSLASSTILTVPTFPVKRRASIITITGRIWWLELTQSKVGAYYTPPGFISVAFHFIKDMELICVTMALQLQYASSSSLQKKPGRWWNKKRCVIKGRIKDITQRVKLNDSFMQMTFIWWWCENWTHTAGTSSSSSSTTHMISWRCSITVNNSQIAPYAHIMIMWKPSRQGTNYYH